MKTLLRIAAVLSFGSFFIGALTLLRNANEPGVMVVGLCFLGTAFFVGPILLVASERLGRKQEGR